MIDQITIERIISAAQITDVVSDFVTLNRRGINLVGLCPFHEDKKPSFYVSPAKNICKCFSCGEGGTPLHFIMKLEQLSYADALRFLAKKYNIEIQEKELTEEQKQRHDDRESMFILNNFAAKLFESNLFEHVEGKSVGLSYFKSRGFREDIIRKFQLGYALEEKDAFTQQALKSGYKKEYLEKTGLTITGENNYIADRFRGRVIFPVHTLAGKIVAFGGRTLKKDAKTAKYVNSPESEIYHKGKELYGLYLARQSMVKHDKCFLVEGYTDVISMHQAGIENVVASSGTALTPGQIRLIHRFTNNITVLYDGDAAGIKAALRGIDLLLEEGMNVKVVLLPEGEDPDSFAGKQSSTSFIQFIKENETDFIRFKTKLLVEEAGNDPVKKANLVSEIVHTIALIPEEIIRLMYVKECSGHLDIDERVLLKSVTEKRREVREKQKLPDNRNYTQPDTGFAVPSSNPLPAGGSQPGVLSGQKNESPLDKFEQQLIRQIIRYGEHILCYVEDNETENPGSEAVPVTVVEYIDGEMKTDELEFSNPLYTRIRREALERIRQEGFVAERYFLNHPDTDISTLAVKMVSEKYPLSKVHSKFRKLEEEADRLLDIVPYEVLNYKDAILCKQMDELSARIKSAQQQEKTEEWMEAFSELTRLKEYKMLIAKHLGERIILKL